MSESLTVMSDSETPWTSPWTPWNSQGENTGGGSLSVLQGIFPTQRSNSGLLHCRRILYQLSHKWSPRILERVAYTFSSRSSQPRNQTRVSHITGGFFTNWAIREARKQNEAREWLTKFRMSISVLGEGKPGGFKDIGDVHDILKLGGGYRSAHLFLIS